MEKINTQVSRLPERTFGERIRAVRKKDGYSQKEFSSLLDIPQSTLSAYETDKMHPTVFSLTKIATTFNVSLDWLCGVEKSLPSDIKQMQEMYMDNLRDLVRSASRRQQFADEAIGRCLDELKLMCSDMKTFEKAEEALLLFIYDGTDTNDNEITLNEFMKNIEEINKG